MIPPVANRFVAGETIPEAIDRGIQANQEGLGAIINLLGEHHTDPETVAVDVRTYRTLIADIDRIGLDACISVKPTQIGLDRSESEFRENLQWIVDSAAAAEQFVWIDMEGSETTAATLRGFEEMADRHPWHVGVCLQSNLKRTSEDIDRFADTPGSIRLVKGAYRESPEIAYSDSGRVDERYRADLEALFRTRDRGIAVGSHDPAMISHAKQLAAVHGGDVEFQMLFGVRPAAQRELATQYRMVQYIPYGSRWLSYFTRRMLERTENLTFAARAVFGRRLEGKL